MSVGNGRAWDRLGAALLVIVALAVGVESSRVPIGRLSQPGPGFLPLLAAGALALLAVALFVEASLRPGILGASRAEPWPGWRKIVLMVAGLLAYALVLEKVGYLLATAPLLALFMVLERQRWLVVLGTALLATLASYWIFAVWLRVPLPRGVFPR